MNVGFLVYDVYADMVRVVYPLDFNSVSKQGIQPNFSILNGDDIPVSDTSEFVNKLTTAFGVVSSASSRSTGLFVRMIPRDFGRPREI